MGHGDLVVSLVAQLRATRLEALGLQELTRAAVHRLHDVQTELDRLKARYFKLLDEHRRERQDAA